MNDTNSMTKVISELVKLFTNVGTESGKERAGDKGEGKAGNVAGVKSV